MNHLSSLRSLDELANASLTSARQMFHHEVLRTCVNLTGHKDVLRMAGSEILLWTREKTKLNLDVESLLLSNFTAGSGCDGVKCEGWRASAGTHDLWVMRIEEKDKAVDGRSWIVEAGLKFGPDMDPTFTTRLSCLTEERILPTERHVPAFVQRIAKQCDMDSHSITLRAAPEIIESANQAEALILEILSNHRTIPIFVLSVSDAAEHIHYSSLNAYALARSMTGLAKVVVLPALQSQILTRRFGKDLSVFGGSARAYQPGFKENANPNEHRLMLGPNLKKPLMAEKASSWIRLSAANTSVRTLELNRDVIVHEGILRLFGKYSLSLDGKSTTSPEYDNEQIRQMKIELERGGEMLAVANTSIDLLQDQLEQEVQIQKMFSEEHQKSEARALKAENELLAAQAKISYLLDKELKEFESDKPAAIVLPETWDALEPWCIEHFSDKVVLTPSAIRSMKNTVFSDVGMVARSIVWLATVNRERRMNGGGKLFEETVEKAVRNAHCGSDEFEFEFNGRRHKADWHIKTGGNSRDPVRCLRIYYAWCYKTKMVIIAHLPSHMTTSAS
jgi:hypothetical protein